MFHHCVVRVHVCECLGVCPCGVGVKFEDALTEIIQTIEVHITRQLMCPLLYRPAPVINVNLTLSSVLSLVLLLVQSYKIMMLLLPISIFHADMFFKDLCSVSTITFYLKIVDFLEGGLFFYNSYDWK